MIVVISGPIASGKSTLARRVASRLSASGVATAVIDLDVVHDMLGAAAVADAWGFARRATGILAAWLEANGVAAVIAEGSFGAPGQRAEIVTASDGSQALFVGLRVSYETALRRAEADPARGRSRDPAFLGPYYADPARSDVADSDVTIDTEGVGIDEATTLVADAVLALLDRPSPARNPLDRAVPEGAD